MEALTRTDEQRLAGAPFTISVGGTPLELRPLPRKKSAKWAKALAEAPIGLAELKLELNLTSADGKFSIEAVKETLRTAAEALADTVPAAIADVVYAYIHLADPTRSREWFDGTATNEETWEALLRFLEIEFPFYSRAARSGGGMAAIARLLSGQADSPKSPSGNGSSTGPISTSGATKSSG